MKIFKNLMFLVVPLLFFAISSVEAQPNLNFKRVINNWPTIELYFSVGCNGKPAYFTDPTFFKVYENGVEIGEFTLWCPDPEGRCAISVALVFDASGSMMGPGQAGAIAAGSAFIDVMDGISDEAAIIWFNSSVTVYQGMTASKSMLHDAVNNLPASGATAVWDGIYAGLQELIANGSNQCRAVIALTDGGDNASIRTPSEVISLANRNRIRVFTIGLGSSIDVALLQAIADQTGGRYYQTPSGAELSQIYQEISTIIFQGFQECVIMYQAKCMDGGLRTVDLQLLNFCGGNDSKTKTYKALKDTSTYVPLTIEVGKKNVRGNSITKIPITLVDPIFNELFYPATFDILFDENCSQFQSISTKGTLLDGVPVTVTPFVGGLTISTKDKILINGTGVLFELTFKASDPEGKDTICCPVKLENWVFEAGCFKPILKNGEICIIPRQPDMICQLAIPNELLWVRGLKDYSPNPFTATMMVSNRGDREAKNVRYTIFVNKADLTLVAPTSANQNGNPRNVFPTENNDVRWDLLAKRRLTGDSVEVCITAYFDNHDSVTCCEKIWIPPADAVLNCSVTAPTILPDNINLKYNPMPFNIDVIVTNEGGRKSDTVFARIVLPSGDLKLGGSDAPNRNTKKILPPLLNPGQSGGVSFTLTHPITLVAKSYIVGVWVKTSNADSSYCEVEIIIPPLQAPILSPRCSTPDSLVFNESIDSYQPNPFTITLYATNIGALPADNVTAFVYLPDGVSFVGAETNRKAFVPSTLNQYVGGPMPYVTWQVKYDKKLRYNTTLVFKFMVGGTGPNGLILDSAETNCETYVPGLKPSFGCILTIPDSLGLNSTETNVEPNPFTIEYKVFNTSRQTAKISTISLYLPSNGVTLHPSTPNSGLNPNRTLNPGDTLTVSWLVNVANQITRRDLLIQVIAYDDEGNPVSCSDNLPIANLKTSLICVANVDNELITFNPILQKYDNELVTFTALLTNSGGAPLNDIVVTLQYDTTYLMLNGDVATKTAPVLFVSQTIPFTWNLKLRQHNTTGINQVALGNIVYKSRETPEISNGCDAYVGIEPVSKPKLECSLATVDTVKFLQVGYNPSVFYVDFTVTNTGTATARNSQIYLLQNTRFILLSQPIFDLGNITAGTTIYGDEPNSFKIKMTPKDFTGYDTIRAVVISDGTEPVICEYYIYVEEHKKPVLDISCITNDVIKFDQQSNGYIPNPITFVVTVGNSGPVVAYNCNIVYVGSKNLVPYDDPIKFIGTLYPGSSETRNFTFNVLPKTYDRYDTLIFEIHGAGGLGEKLIINRCTTVVFVPGTLSAKYDQICTAQTITFDNTSGVYVPDPFAVTTVITNNGKSLGQDITATIILSPDVMLAPGESMVKSLGNIDVNNSTNVTWLLRPILTFVDINTQVCFEIKDKFNNTSVCCVNIFIPKANQRTLSISCDSPTDMKVAIDISNYENNPFNVSAIVTNNSQRTIDSVYLTLVSNEYLKLLTANVQFVALSLDPGVSASANWSVYATPSIKDVIGKLSFIASAKSVPSSKCNRDIVIPAIPQPELQCRINTVSMITFNNGIGMYNGNKSIHGQYNTTSVSVTITNNGDGVARNVLTSLLLPDGLVLETGEVPFILVNKLLPHESKTFTWNVYPIRVNIDTPKLLKATIQETKYNTWCEYETVIQGAPKLGVVTLPVDVVAKYLANIQVPIYVSPMIGNDLKTVNLVIKYDNNILTFVGADKYVNSAMNNWKNFSYSESNGYIYINALTTSLPINTTNQEIMIVLTFSTKMNPTTNITTNLEFDVNNSYLNNGDIITTYQDGIVTISNECIMPLLATYELKQNKPNPFVSVSSVEYTLGEDGFVTITIYDILGNIVDTPVKTTQKKGNYIININSNKIGNGTYYYSLDVNGFRDIKKMVILK